MPDGLTEVQKNLLDSWLGEFSTVHDHSWPLQDTTVLHIRTSTGEDFIVKASVTSHHIRREITAHARGFTGLYGRVPVLVHASTEAKLLVTEFLPGSLVEGTTAEGAPETYRQAGALLGRIHKPAGVSRDYATALAIKTQSAVDRAQGLVPEDWRVRLAAELEALNPGPVQLATTHGDYQPRNWLQEDGTIKVIDFGRADARPWVHDLVRLTHQQFVERPDLEDAFYAGLGMKVEAPDEDIWRLENLNQAISTVVWGHQIGDAAFERSGVGMVERVLSGL
ncbi:phosphotransferase family protein [Arthrobacter sp. 35W]|uniref:phosphotransferase family protein n=1 Tax=Arthrobacter sp. 35W TaxID=1132441 RepID=UPI000413C8F5|nr:aminoglycoside phosphotransferase family protein [Arthrobacter sp. 35W]